VDMNCQQICENSPKKTSEVKIFQKVLGGYIFLKHPVHSVHKKKSDFIFLLTPRKINEFEGKFQVYIVAERMPIHLETSCLFLNILCK